MAQRFLLKPSLFLTAAVLGLALAYPLVSDRLGELAKEFYGSTDHVLYPFLAARVVGYGSFFWILLAALMVWCAALWKDARNKRNEAAISGGRLSHAPRVLEGLVFLGMATVAVLLSDREWRRFGRPCWDNYCLYSELIINWFRHPSSEASWTDLHSFLRSDYHCNSPLVPVLVAGTKLASGIGVLSSYRLVCGAATVLGLFVLFRFLRRRLGVSGPDAAAIVLLLTSNIAVIRCFCFPQTDAFVFLWITLALTQAVAFLEEPSRHRAAICFVIVASGLFIKLSFLPALAMIPLWTWLARTRGSAAPSGARRTLVRRTLIFVLGPLLLYMAFQLSLGLVSMYGREFSRMTTPDNFPLFHLISLVQTGAVLIPLVIIGRHQWTKMDRYILVWTGLYLLSLWGGRTSGWDRFYLPIIPPLAIVSRHGVAVLRDKLSTTTASIGIALHALMNYAALLLNLYQ